MSELLEEPRHFCALGAQQTVVAIERAIPILHAGPGCSAKLSAGMAGCGGHQGTGYAGGDAIPCSNMVERDVVFGAEKKLKKLIEGTLKIMDGDLFVVLTGCTSDIIGDDVANVVSEFQEKGVPIVYAETAGFKGDAYAGHELVLEAIINQYLKDDGKRISGLVNIFSSVPIHDPFWEGDLREIKRLLESIGLKANILFGYKSGGINAINAIPHAEFNIVISPWVGIKTAELLKKKFGTPYLHCPVFPIGGVETSKFLNRVGEFTGMDKKIVDKVIKREEDEYYHYLTRFADFFIEFRYDLPKRFFNINNTTYALAISRFLANDLGLLPGHQFITENVPERFKNNIREYFKDIVPGISSEITFSQDGGIINEKLLEFTAETAPLILGSSWDVDAASQIGGINLSVGLPITDRVILHHNYAGYSGGLNLIEDIYSKILSRHN
ncbi:nitrogenase component 1 [Clostridium luticellarii]|jgi:nitrogenase molybdenum-iron protein beta chain|uniref:Nitrogenase molybdenum-iron protein beta chain n=1 Tax=Clostridium luticellarii TaxID=1691940 RepID=A0A2T0BNJ4_9CLOT|nr:nitrogenase component 1 [Clostridium luticellarii]MCI1945833.1 hydrogenase [Clostridium luticellarii]MCI1968977.1 hydrogenase [Clostridium luticellarii]MCI1996268.1 hydrogenase [Clostridium luticellarii]MCI2040328.1 hydrogenase [Clostridium luticellarii]PRR85437.1 Nitrogenase molybdenum-iron protein beta chain [Clostridium luticellarii]